MNHVALRDRAWQTSLGAPLIAVILVAACAFASRPLAAATPSAPSESALPPTGKDPCLGQTVFEDQIGADQTVTTRSSIRLVSTVPQSDTPLGEDTVLLAYLEYSVKDFEAGHFVVMAAANSFPSLPTQNPLLGYATAESEAQKAASVLPSIKAAISQI